MSLIFRSKKVRAFSNKGHQKGKVKEFWFASLRSATNSYSILGAKTNWRFCKIWFEPTLFLWVLTDNGSEFKKRFSEKLKELHLTHYHTYPKTPKMNSRVERFNRRLVDYLIFYNTERVRYAFKNKLSPVQFMIQRQEQKLSLGPLPNQTVNQLIKMPAESKIGWHYTQL